MPSKSTATAKAMRGPAVKPKRKTTPAPTATADAMKRRKPARGAR